YAEVAALLCGVNERTADIVVADETELVRDAALLGVAERSGVRRVGNAEHAVGIGRLLLCQLMPERAARAIDADAPYARIGSREVDQLEDAGGGSLRATQTR